MTHEQKVNWIKCWLQKFGNRDNETFNVEVTVGDITWAISLQYDYDFDGEKYDPQDWCCKGFKHVFNNHIDDRSEEELDAIIEQLKAKQTHH